MNSQIFHILKRYHKITSTGKCKNRMNQVLFRSIEKCLKISLHTHANCQSNYLKHKNAQRKKDLLINGPIHL